MSWSLLVILFLVLGFILLLIELCVIPGFGVVGIAGIFSILTGEYLAWTKLSMVWAIVATVSSILAIIGSLIFLKKSGIVNRFVLGHRIGEGEGSKETGTGYGHEKNQGKPLLLVGQVGLSLTDLRPVGIAQFRNQRISVITEGVYLKKNSRVKIQRIEGNKIWVEEEKD